MGCWLMRLGRCDDASWLWSDRTEKKNQTKRNETTKSCKGLRRDYDYDYPVWWPKNDAKTKTKSPADGKFASFQLCSSGNCDTMRCDAMLMAWINFNAFLHPLGDLENFKEFE